MIRVKPRRLLGLAMLISVLLLSSMVQVAQAQPDPEGLGPCDIDHSGNWAPSPVIRIHYECQLDFETGQWVWVPRPDLTPPPVAAVYAVTFNDLVEIVKTDSSLSNGISGGPYSVSDAYSSFTGGPEFARPPGYFANRIQLLNWTGSSWNVCRDSGFFYNSVATANFTLVWNHGVAPPCGAGSYGTYSGAFQFDGFWKGNWLFSGSDCFACGRPTAPGPPPALGSSSSGVLPPGLTVIQGSR